MSIKGMGEGVPREETGRKQAGDERQGQISKAL